ncbi:CYTH domain-containing protein, partial [Corynebacterium phoceense]
MAITSALEIEAKFAVDSSAELPDLTTLPEIGSVAREEHHELSAIYFDTPDLRLTRAKMTLRRRTGGNDSGWHIKTPTAAGRQELHAPLDDAADGNYIVPAELLAEIRSLVRNLPLKPIAQVDNKRAEITYADPEGNPVVEFCDDHVTAKSFLPAGKETRWREWEVELTGVAAEAAAQAAEAPA